MSDDIVKRLRDPILDVAFFLRHEAADEIERLQHIISAQAQDIVTLGQLAGRGVEREARIAALEGALENLLDVQNGPPLRRYEVDWKMAVDAARAALAKNNQTG